MALGKGRANSIYKDFFFLFSGCTVIVKPEKGTKIFIKLSKY